MKAEIDKNETIIFVFTFYFTFVFSFFITLE